MLQDIFDLKKKIVIMFNFNGVYTLHIINLFCAFDSVFDY